MNEILILKDVTYASKIGGGVISGINEVNLLADGALAVFDNTNTLLTAANVTATILDKKSIYFALGSGDSTLGAKISQYVQREPITRVNYEAKPYIAPVKQIITIGLDGTGSMNIATPVAGTFAYLRIIDTTDTNVNLIRAERYSYEVKTGDAAADVVAGVVAAANANTETIYLVESINTNQGVKVTALSFGQTFEIGLDGIISAANIKDDGTGTSKVIVFGSGTPTEVAAFESEFNSEDGNTSRLWLANQYWSVPSKVDTSAKYMLNNIQWTASRTGAILPAMTANMQIIVAIPSNLSNLLLTTWQTIVEQAFGVNSINSETAS